MRRIHALQVEEAPPQITADEVVDAIRSHKVLGITLDSLFRSIAHGTGICNKLGSMNTVLMSLAGSTWGMHKETLLTTYKAIGRFCGKLCSACVVSECERHIVEQHTGLSERRPDHCDRVSPGDHLYEEVKILPARRHNFVLSRQYMLGCYRRNHHSNHLVDRLPSLRQIRKDLGDLEREVQRCKRESLYQGAYQPGLNDIHSDAVSKAEFEADVK